MTDTDEATIRLEEGEVLRRWKSYSINSNFLTPTDGWDFTFGTEVEWKIVRDLIEPDRKVEILIDGVLQLTGWIDNRTASADVDGGTVITVHGRDVLKPLCKGNVWPGFAIKGKTILQIIEGVIQQTYIGQTVVVISDPDANRLLIADPSKKYQKHSNAKANSKRKAKLHNVMEYYQAHPSEGSFEFLSRMLRKNGLWMWASADGNIVVSGPDYEQPSMYVLQRKRGDRSAHVIRSSDVWDMTSVPSFIQIVGKGASKDYAKTPVKGLVENKGWRLHAPMYVRHDEATTNDEATNFAEQEMSRLMQESRVYECTVRGHRNPVTNAIYQPNTIATIADEILGVDGDWWILDRTFSKSVDSGTTTTLKLLPKYAVRLSDVDAP